MTQQYTILDNGGQPFKVIIYENNFLQVYTYDEADYNIYNILVYETYFNNIFIGQHPINNNEFNKQLEGNSILVELEDYKYVFIGMNIFQFESLSKINYYLSPVGNNCVPYPYAVDENNNIYLMIENIIMILEDDTFEYIKTISSPYSFYYKHVPQYNYNYVTHQLPNYNELVKRI